jgi:hypothetical protein
MLERNNLLRKPSFGAGGFVSMLRYGTQEHRHAKTTLNGNVLNRGDGFGFAGIATVFPFWGSCSSPSSDRVYRKLMEA